MTTLNHAQQTTVINAALAYAQSQQWAVTVAICDPGGHLLALQRMDRAPAISAHIAPEKAKTAALSGKASQVYEEMINQGRTAFLSVPALQGMLTGGLPIIQDGLCIGAIGVSGVKPDQDVAIAQAGLAALGAA
ncbi:GlcG/HbpS family heme-binding protein [Parvibium lacunae]|uniref:Heme-binding protein n=1 Tax=Parvibium lacunae TaxID=1888893 RepID=A0A368L973_9BURK|nr:heme-binding protein [Parvibium lacunae]RCS59789.1 heme-binding protein [Parvibium lacunae]